MGSIVTLAYLKAIVRGVEYMEYVEIALQNGQDIGIVRTIILRWLEEYRGLIGYDTDRCLYKLDSLLKEIGDEDGLMREAMQYDEEKLLKKCLGMVDMDGGEVLNSSQRIWQLLDGITDRIGEDDNPDSLLVYTDSFHLIWMALSCQFFSVYRLKLNRLKEETDCQHFSDNDRQEPDVLNRPEIREVFGKAVEKKLMDEDGNWFESQSLLAIFCQRIFFKYLIKPHPGLNPDGTPKKEWKPFEEYFRVKKKRIDLRGAFKNAKNNPPKKLYLIDDIIAETPQTKEDREI